MPPHSKVLVYLAGHGGDEFLKFSDTFELSSTELADGLEQMALLQRCAEVLLVVDTCQASTMADAWHDQLHATLVDTGATSAEGSSGKAADDGTAGRLVSAPPRAVSLMSSARGENSYSLEVDREIGVALSDRFTFHLARYLLRTSPNARLADAEERLHRARTLSTVVRRSTGWQVPAGAIRIRDFFGLALERQPALAAAVPDGATRASRSRDGGGSSGSAAGEALPLVSTTARWRAYELRRFWGFLQPPQPSQGGRNVWPAEPITPGCRGGMGAGLRNTMLGASACALLALLAASTAAPAARRRGPPIAPKQ